jgi:hypothetical protein
MRNFESRLCRLEKNSGESTVSAIAESGEAIHIHKNDMLPLTCAAFRQRYAQIEGLPAPVSPFDSKLAFLKRFAVRCTAPLVEVISGVLR